MIKLQQTIMGCQKDMLETLGELNWTWNYFFEQLGAPRC